MRMKIISNNDYFYKNFFENFKVTITYHYLLVLQSYTWKVTQVQMERFWDSILNSHTYFRWNFMLKILYEVAMQSSLHTSIELQLIRWKELTELFIQILEKQKCWKLISENHITFCIIYMIPMQFIPFIVYSLFLIVIT